VVSPRANNYRTLSYSLGGTALSNVTAFRKFADQLAVNQAATFAEMINGFGVARARTLLAHERIILVIAALLVKNGDTPALTLLVGSIFQISWVLDENNSRRQIIMDDDHPIRLFHDIRGSASYLIFRSNSHPPPPAS